MFGSPQIKMTQQTSSRLDFPSGLLQLPGDRSRSGQAPRPFPFLLPPDGQAAGPRDHLGSRVGVGGPARGSLRLTSPRAGPTSLQWMCAGPPGADLAHETKNTRHGTSPCQPWAPAMRSRGRGSPRRLLGRLSRHRGEGVAGLTAGPLALIQPCVSRPDGRPEPSLRVLLGGKKKNAFQTTR